MQFHKYIISIHHSRHTTLSNYVHFILVHYQLCCPENSTYSIDLSIGHFDSSESRILLYIMTFQYLTVLFQGYILFFLIFLYYCMQYREYEPHIVPVVNFCTSIPFKSIFSHIPLPYCFYTQNAKFFHTFPMDIGQSTKLE